MDGAQVVARPEARLLGEILVGPRWENSRMGELEERARVAAEEALAAQDYVAPIDLLIGLRWLMQNQIDAWRQGRTTQPLDHSIQVKPEKRASI